MMILLNIYLVVAVLAAVFAFALMGTQGLEKDFEAFTGKKLGLKHQIIAALMFGLLWPYTVYEMVTA